MIKIFLSYSHNDEKYRIEFDKHLTILKHQGIIETWHDRCILPGKEWTNQIDENLRNADIILLLISADYISSKYCYELEMQEALSRHNHNEAVVIPVILRPCLWQGLPFGKLQAATKDGKPVEKYPTLDDAFLEITQAIDAVAKKLAKPETTATSTINLALSENIDLTYPDSQTSNLPRSSNLFIPKKFTDHDKDIFVADAYDYISKYFEGSLLELQKRNPDITTRFQKLDACSFEATIYRNGKQVSKCGIWLGNSHGLSRGTPSIVFSHSGIGHRQSFNESMSICDNGNMLGLEPMGMSYVHRTEKGSLTNRGSAEYYWNMFFEPVQHI